MPRTAKAGTELRAKALLELRRRQRDIAEQVARQGYQQTGSIPEGMTFRQWCEQLAAGGLLVDGIPFTLDDRPSMHFVYDQVPSTIAEGYGRTVVMMKCAQVGFTVMEMLAGIYMALRFPPLKIGMYLPDRALAAAKSAIRFLPIVRTIPDAYSLLTTDNATGKRRQGGEGNVMIRSMGQSRFHFLWTTGKSATESFPMDVLTFDEVQNMLVKDMEKTQERLSASRLKYTLMGSTANWPDMDIHWWYQRGTQHQFHTFCPHCGGTQVMDEVFPACIGYDEENQEYRYKCTAEDCGGWIEDAQIGDWIPRNPEAEFVSLHYTQFLSPTISPRELMKSFLDADDMKNFYCRKLGKPYTDPSQVPVDLAALNACVEAGREAGVVWKSSARETYMGIDQMGNFNVAIIKERLPDGRQAVIHLEYIFSADPFARCSELIDQYGVVVACVETNPNYNDAKRFAHKHNFPENNGARRCTVFLANYGDITDEMMRWGDTQPNKTDRKLAEEERDRFSVLIDQYKCMQVSMKRLLNKNTLFADPQGLTQEVFEKGQRRVVAPLKDLAFLHFTRTALVAEKDPEQKKYRRKVVKVGIDPHTSYANMLCDVAWARNHGTGMMILPDAVSNEPSTAMAKKLASLPGIPSDVAAMVDDLPESVCGRCSAFNAENGACSARGFNVQPRDASCPIYSRKT